MSREELEKPAWKLFPIAAAAVRLGWHVETLREWIERGIIASHKMPGPGGRVMIPESELDRIMADRYRSRST
jgi:excisionase family DNA binding protein